MLAPPGPDRNMIGALLRQTLSLSDAEVTFRRRGFVCTREEARQRLESVGRYFLAGYHLALREGRLAPLARALDALPVLYRGFAYEGAAMSLALTDALSFWRGPRLPGFLREFADAHCYMVHIGAGWALARLPRFLHGRVLAPLDGLLVPLAYDGYGFHQGYFHWRQSIEGQQVPAAVQAEARNAFDQGLGRSLWFVRGADVKAIANTIARFPEVRRADLWSGAGLAAAYAGGVAREDLEALAMACGEHLHAAAQGVAFAAKARARAGIPAEHTQLAAGAFWRASSEVAAAVTDAALPRETGYDAYARWRAAIQEEHRRQWHAPSVSCAATPSALLLS